MWKIGLAISQVPLTAPSNGPKKFQQLLIASGGEYQHEKDDGYSPTLQRPCFASQFLMV
ncbi:hypothetical protein SK128_019918, partial [Halocaridina rubra]